MLPRFHVCRFCEITFESFKNSPLDKHTKRKISTHNTTVDLLQNSDTISICGIKSNSVFNQLNFFHVCTPGLPPCIGYNIFEGVVAYDIPIFIKTKLWFTYKQLNTAIANFPYKGEDARNKPSTISPNSDKLSGHAIQNWTLLRFLGMYLRYKIRDPSNAVWELICILQDIVILICSAKISVTQIAYLDVLIQDYLHHRHTLFPTLHLCPKHHYMSHYPQLILQFCPLIWVWTMRFESKHSFFKKCTRIDKNFINITSTLAEKHEPYQAYLRSGLYFEKMVQKENSFPFLFNSFNSTINNAVQKCFITDKNLSYAEKIFINGKPITVGQGVAIEADVYLKMAS